MKSVAYASEAALCQEFIPWARKGGNGRQPWTVYPETGGFDMLLVDPHGRQLGIEAKLTMNAKVCAQALPGYWHDGEGPDWRGILVPKVNDDLAKLMAIYGIVIFTPRNNGMRNPDFSPDLYHSEMQYQPWFDWNPSKRCELPPMVHDVPCGVPSPIRLTAWKVGALKVLAHIELRGSITAKDIREIGIDSRRFCATDGWLKSIGDGKWVRGSVPAFDQQHPDVYAQTIADLKSRSLVA